MHSRGVCATTVPGFNNLGGSIMERHKIVVAWTALISLMLLVTGWGMRILGQVRQGAEP